MTKDQFIQRVLLIMNEAGMFDQHGSSFIGADSAQVDKHIEGSYVDAWRRAAKVAPRTWLGNKSMKIPRLVDSSGGGIQTHSMFAEGTGYKVGDQLSVTNGNGNGTAATVQVLAVSGGATGPVTLYELLTPGSIYTIGPSHATTGGTGTGFKLHILTIQPIVHSTEFSLPTVPSLTEGTGYVVIPDDFYLLSKFKMTGWKVACMEAAIANSRVTNIQSNEFTRGSQLRPAVVINNKDIDGVIKPVLEYYSLPKGLSSHTVDEALYVPVVEELFEKLGTYDLGISDQIIAPLVYLSAATVFTIFEKYPVAQALEARAEAMLPGLISLKGTNATVKQ